MISLCDVGVYIALLSFNILDFLVVFSKLGVNMIDYLLLVLLSLDYFPLSKN